MSLAELPANLTDPTGGPLLPQLAGDDLLAHLLRDLRVERCRQFCVEPYGAWRVDAAPRPFRPPGSVSFHVVMEGRIWIELGGERFTAESGDVVILPHATQHFLGVGQAGRLLDPCGDLPPLPWHGIPQLTYAAAGERTRMLCGFLEARVLDFQPLTTALPAIMLARPAADAEDWLAPAVRRLIREAGAPSPGGTIIAARLCEILFIELLRRQMLLAQAGSSGWLSALGDPILRRALQALHAAPETGWTQQSLAAAVGVSKTVLCERFQRVLEMAPIRYLRDWRLYLASAELADTGTPIIAVAGRAGYGTEAAFSRAFARRYGVPPAAWRKRAQRAA